MESKPRFLLLLLLVLIVFSAFLRLFHLSWGAPFYFHPDERNIASSISQLQFPSQLNPHFFAYGSLPIYSAYFGGLILNFFTSCHNVINGCLVQFEQGILILRIISALVSILIIPLTYLASERIKKSSGLLAAFLSTVSVGYIQFAHFGTVETLLTFFSLLLFILLLQMLNKQTFLQIVLVGFLVGILVSIKISSIVVILLPLLVFSLFSEKSFKKKVFLFIRKTAVMILVATSVYFLTNPFVLLDSASFRGSMKYEGGVVTGSIPVFYTGEFFHTIPGVFQFLSIYPFLLNPLVTLLFLISLIWIGKKAMVNHDKKLLLLLGFFLVLFIPQAILFAKWTRYILPTLPFIYILISLFVLDLKRMRGVIIGLVVLISLIFGLSYFYTAFIETQTPITAAEFAKSNISPSAKTLSEVYDLGIVPFNEHLSNVTLFNFYELDNHNPEFTIQTLDSQLSQSDYIILPSQRILKTRIINKDKFPTGQKFYSKLTSGQLPFKKIYESRCSIFCKISYLGDPVFRFEETASVFERPVVMIYKKQ